VVDSVAALMEGLILWWFCGCDGGSIHCMWLGCLVLFCQLEVWWESCFAGVKHGGKVKNKNK
jgi:hypothetical protein